MRKLASFVSVVCIINVLMFAGLVGFLLATGRLDKAKTQSISDLLRHEGSPEGLRGKVAEILSPAAHTQPATASAPAAHVASAGSPDVPATAEERIDYVRKVLEQERLALENEKQFLREQHKLLDQRQETLTAAEAAFAQHKKDLEQKLATKTATTDNAGFQKSLALFDELKPKQVKDLLSSMSADDVASYLAAMPGDRVAKIVAEFKTADEKKLLNAALNKIRGQNEPFGTGAASGAAAGTPSLTASPGKAGT
jgi:hypothetical protein